MKSKLVLMLALLSLLVVLMPSLIGLAQDGGEGTEPAIWEYVAIQIGDFDVYEFSEVQPGDTIYVFLESLDTDVNVALGGIFYRDNIAEPLAATFFEEEAAQGILGNTLQYTVESDQRIVLVVSTQEPEAEYRLLVGRNAPEALTGTAETSGPPFVRPVENDLSILVRGCEDSPASEETPRLGSQDDPAPAQEILSTLEASPDRHLYNMPGLVAGDVVYVYLEAWCSQLDTTLEIVSATETTISYGFNDDFRQTNSGLEFTVPADGDYALIVASFAGTSSGDYRLAVGINTPEILDGAFVENGTELVRFAEILPPAEATAPAEQAVETARGCVGDEARLDDLPRVGPDDGTAQQIIGSLTIPVDRNLYVLPEMVAGDIVYAYVERWCSDLDTTLTLVNANNPDQQLAFSDDFRQTNSGLEFEIPEDGDYGLIIGSYDGGSSGDYRLAVGINTPPILDAALVEDGTDFVAFEGTLPPPQGAGGDAGPPSAAPGPGAPDTTTVVRGCQGDEAALASAPVIGSANRAPIRAEEDRLTLRSTGARHYYDLEGLQAGDVLYAYAEAWCSDLDATLSIVNNDDPETPLAFNDDYVSRNPGLVFEVPRDGDYGIVIASYSGYTQGTYRLAVGVNQPAILDGALIENGSDLLRFNRRLSLLADSQRPIQIIEDGRFRFGEVPSMRYDIRDLLQDETLYIYMRSLTDGLDPLIRLHGPLAGDDNLMETAAVPVVASDDDSGAGVDAALEYVVAKPGDYYVEVFACCGGRTTGSYELLVGINTPEVLEGSGEATGDILINTGAARKLGTPSTVETITGYIEGRHSHYHEIIADDFEGSVLFATARTTRGNGTPQLHLIEVTGDVTLRDVLQKEGRGRIASGEPVESNLKAVRLNSDPQTPLENGKRYFVEVSMTQPFETSNVDGRLIGEYELIVGLNRPDIVGSEAAAPADTVELLQIAGKLQADSSTTTDRRIERLERSLPLEAITVTEDETPVFQGQQTLILRSVGAGDSVFLNLTTDRAVDEISLSLDVPALASDVTLSPSVTTTNRAGLQMRYTFTGFAENVPVILLMRTTADDNAVPDDVSYRLLASVNEPAILAVEDAYTNADNSLSDTRKRIFVDNAPIGIETGVELLQITEVDQKSENFSVVAVLRARWHDVSQIFHVADNEGRVEKRLNNTQFEAFLEGNATFVWPEFVLQNQQGDREVQNQALTIHTDGTITYEERFTATFQAPDFDFRSFPFDDQIFKIVVQTIFPETRYVMQVEDDFASVGNQLGEEEWIVTGNTSVINTDDGFSQYEFQIFVSRQRNFYYWRILIPLALIIFMGYAILFIRDNELRVTASSGNLLLFIAFNFTIGDDLPRLGYLTFLDLLLMVAFVITTLVFITDVFLFRTLGKEEAQEEALADAAATGEQLPLAIRYAYRMERAMKFIYPLAYLFVIGYLILEYL